MIGTCLSKHFSNKINIVQVCTTGARPVFSAMTPAKCSRSVVAIRANCGWIRRLSDQRVMTVVFLAEGQEAITPLRGKAWRILY